MLATMLGDAHHSQQKWLVLSFVVHATARQKLSCTYLALHELESVSMFIIFAMVIVPISLQ